MAVTHIPMLIVYGENVTAPAMFDRLLGVPNPLLGRLDGVEKAEVLFYNNLAYLEDVRGDMWILTAFYELFGEIVLNRLIKIIPLFKRFVPELYRVAHR